MFKEAFFCGLGMAIDLSGSYYNHSQPPPMHTDQRIAHYWQCVGKALQFSIAAEHPRIEEVKLRQLQLNLDCDADGKAKTH